ncbi:MAG: hypothetical protein AAGF25_09615 [Pseudomonadota bacterium]
MSKIFTWIIVGLALLCLCVLNYVEFFVLHPLNGGLMSPDFRFLGYNFDDFVLWQTELGELGSAAYINWFPNGVDKFFPALVGLSVALLLHQTLSRFPRYGNRSVLLKCLIPVAISFPYVFFDYFENQVLLDAVRAGSNAGYGMIQFASSLTVLKASFLTIALIILVGFWMSSLKTKAYSK